MPRGDLSGVVLDGRYQIVERMAEGAMGEVYRGLRLQLNRAVAIKVMHASLPGAMASRDRFEREIKLMALLEHPHCVSVIDFGIYDDKPYVVMELVRGRSLHDLLVDQRRFAIPRAADILHQVLSGLAHAHDQGIIHRDIKPANIMITPKAPLGVHARILDFGLARLRESSTSLTDGVAVGTPSYMAPEQCRGDEVDVRVDLYACGVVLFEMVTGRKPFVATDPIDIVKKQLYEPAPRLSDVAGEDFGELEAVVARALAKAPRDRFGSAAAMSDALDAAVAGRIAPEATAAFGLGSTDAAEPLGSSALVPIDASIEVPISVEVPITVESPPAPSEASRARQDRHDTSMLRRMLPVSRMRYVVLAALLLGGAALYGIVLWKSDMREAANRDDAGPIADAAVLAAPPVDASDPVAIAVVSAEELAAADKFYPALDVIAKARRDHPEDGALPYVAGRIYFAKLWWADGIKNFREAIRLDPRLRTEPGLVKMVVWGFVTTPDYDPRLGAFVRELGDAAKSYLEETSRTHANPQVRARAAAELRRLH